MLAKVNGMLILTSLMCVLQENTKMKSCWLALMLLLVWVLWKERVKNPRPLMLLMEITMLIMLAWGLETFLEVNSYTALTTYFKKKSYATWTHPRSKKPHQIDHFLSEKIQFSRFTDASLADPLLDSDHLAIMCKLRIAAKLKKRTPDIGQKILHLEATIFER